MQGMSAGRAVGLIAVWAGVVLLGSTVVWVVISRVGGELSRQPTAASASPDPVMTPEASRAPKGDTQGPGGGASPESSSPSDVDPSDATVSDTWSGLSGTVQVSCRGTRVTDWSASPDVGWYLETEREDGGIRAEFEQEGEGREVRVEVLCTPDGPTFLTSNENT